ncbi:universal stress protein [Dechloromonas sp. XY25]|uniref:Universal stress protein n=1 Tax=Dechloromonas hankyongensis TaxID=2908002 RepID=A0ABS9K3Y6_9RHOO|nr:universal stress protein [Dechloromonas hankyongensis]MCG2577851.1 universal stress protein [Dechloromonas hankyongensis]
MYQNILVAIDDSETSRCALAEAKHIARTSQAKLYIVHVVDEVLLSMHGHAMLDMGGADVAVTNLRRAGQALLDNALQDVGGMEVEAVLLEAQKRRVSETIADKAKELAVDLIVIGRHGQRGLATLLLGSVAEQLAKISNASVLLVRKH